LHTVSAQTAFWGVFWGTYFGKIMVHNI